MKYARIEHTRTVQRDQQEFVARTPEMHFAHLYISYVRYMYVEYVVGSYVYISQVAEREIQCGEDS